MKFSSTILLFLALWSSFASGFSRLASFNTIHHHQKNGKPNQFALAALESTTTSLSSSKRIFTAAGENKINTPRGIFPRLGARTVAATSTSGSSTTTTALSLLRQRPDLIGLYTSSSRIPRGGGGGGSGAAAPKPSSTTTPLKQQQDAVGGGTTNTPYNTGTKCPATGAMTLLSSLWGTGGVLYILVKAIQRVLPIALEPFQQANPASTLRPLSQFELGAYIVTCLWFAYVEGYKGFQQKFSPLVVKRSFTLIPGRNGTKWYHYIFAPFYSMGMIHATSKRRIVSWSVSIGIAMIVALVKRFPYPWRNIIDAGVAVGLSWGSCSIVLLYVNSWLTGQPPANVNAALPTTTTNDNNGGGSSSSDNNNKN